MKKKAPTAPLTFVSACAAHSDAVATIIVTGFPVIGPVGGVKAAIDLGNAGQRVVSFTIFGQGHIVGVLTITKSGKKTSILDVCVSMSRDGFDAPVLADHLTRFIRGLITDHPRGRAWITADVTEDGPMAGLMVGAGWFKTQTERAGLRRFLMAVRAGEDRDEEEKDA